MRKNIVFVERVSFTDVRFVFVNLAQQPPFPFKKKRTWERRFTAGPTAQAFASSSLETILNDILFEQHQIATLNLHLERSYDLLVNLYHSHSRNGKCN